MNSLCKLRLRPPTCPNGIMGARRNLASFSTRTTRLKSPALLKSASKLTYEAPNEQARIIQLGYISGITSFLFLMSWGTMLGQFMREQQEDGTQTLASQTKRVLIAGGLTGLGIGILVATRKTAQRTIASMSMSKDGVLSVKTFSKATHLIPMDAANLVKKSPTSWHLIHGNDKLFLHPDGVYKPNRDLWTYTLEE